MNTIKKKTIMNETFRIFLISIFVISIALFYTFTPIGAEEDVLVIEILDEDAYWTPERLRNAQPLPLPTVDGEAIEQDNDVDFDDNEEIEGEDGQAPTLNVEPEEISLFEPFEIEPDQDTDLVPEDRGTRLADYSSSRPVPISSDRSYPYRTTGKLFFRNASGGTSWCTASVIKFRIVVTAGHCVHRGSGGTRGFFSNFRFIPAFRNGSAPWGIWTARRVGTTGTWAGGGGTVLNAQDVGMLEINDRSGRRIGNVLGWLGWQTHSLRANHVHSLGYPGNLDRGNIIHQVTAQNKRLASNNNVEYGSDMRGGSSGGPWIQNFGQRASGQPSGSNPGMNRVVAVTSAGFTGTSQKSQFASQFDSRFVSLWNVMCAGRAGNC